MKKLRVGIIGAGAIAKEAHILNYRLLPNVEIVAIADVVFEKAIAMAKEFSIPHYFQQYEEMLENVELDAVSICTPNKFHAAASIAAMKAGCHVLCEKPPAMTPEETEEMLVVSKETKKQLTYALCYRYSPEVLALKKYTDHGELGEIYAATVHALRRRGIPGWGVFTNKELQGGGPLIDIGVHMIDAALHLMGYPEPDTVLGVTYQKLGTKPGVGILGEWDWQNFSVEDMARGMITFKNGASLLIDTSFAANIEKHEELNVTLMGEDGGANVFPLKIFQEKHDMLVDITPSYFGNDNRYTLQIKEFVKHCLEDKYDPSVTEEGVILQKIIHGLYESAEKQAPVKF